MQYKIFLLTGIVLLFVAGYQLKGSIDFIHRSERATGRVTALEMFDGAYSPVFTLQTENGILVEYRHAAASNPPAWDVGEEVMFLYDPENPGSPRMMRYFWIFNWTLLWTAIAVPLIIIGGGHLLLRPLFHVHHQTPRAI